MGEAVGEVVTVVADGVEFYVEVAEAGGPSNVGLGDVLSFSGVRSTIQAIAGELTSAWSVVRPHEASVEFSLALKAKEGKLTGLLVGGGAEASLKVTLKWNGADAAPTSVGAAGEPGAAHEEPLPDAAS
jgi:hypothetical protein